MLLSMGSLLGRKVFGGNVKTVAGGVGVQGKMHSGRSPTDAEKYDNFIEKKKLLDEMAAVSSTNSFDSKKHHIFTRRSIRSLSLN
nr:hypothetical protein Itr_chr11CG24210 [Ipomoea trifida]